MKYDSDDLIYNRFDIIHSKNVKRYIYQVGNEEYDIDCFFSKYGAYINVWGKVFPEHVFNKVILQIFLENKKTKYVSITRGGNNYNNELKSVNDFKIILPDTYDELLKRLSSKHRYNIRRSFRMMNDDLPNVIVKKYKKNNIPKHLVEIYFGWKKKSHGIDYNMSVDEYFSQYYVTDIITMESNNGLIAILFFSVINKTVYFENFSYDIEYEKYSPGFIIYVLFLKELIARHCKYVFLQGGQYSYKKHFDAQEMVTYSGEIYRSTVYEDINGFFCEKKIKNVAIYGLGECGKNFLLMARKLSVNVVYGIDKKKIEAEIPVYGLNDELTDVDAVFITLEKHNIDAETFVMQKFEKVYYWKDILNTVIGEK